MKYFMFEMKFYEAGFFGPTFFDWAGPGRAYL